MSEQGGEARPSARNANPHILFFSQYFPPEMGAPASRVFDNARRWVSAGARVTVVAGVPNHPTGKIHPGYKNRLLHHEVRDGIHVYRPWIFVAPNAGRVRRSLNYVSYMVSAILASPVVNDVDVVVATSPQFLCAVAGYVVSLLKRRPFVMEVRDLWPDSIRAVQAVNDEALLRFLERVERFLYARAARIVVVTHSFREAIIGKGVDGKKIDLVPNGVDVDFFHPDIDAHGVREELGLRGEFLVSYIGTHGMAHGLETLLQAAMLLESNHSIQILMVGEGAERARLESLRSALGLTNVRMLPYQSRERVRQFIAVSDVCVVLLRDRPLFRTVIPSKIFEFMGMGKPVINAVRGESAALVERSGGGVVVAPEDPQALADAILDSEMHRSMWRAMGRRGREFVKEHYNRDALAVHYLDILKRLVSERTASGSPATVKRTGENTNA